MNIAELAKRHTAAFVIAMLMIVFGLAEVATSFNHEFFGLVTTTAVVTTVVGVILGLCYVVAGFLLATLRPRALTIAIVLLGVDVCGRVLMMVTGMYPMMSAKQSFGIIAGTAIAAAFAVFVCFKRRSLVASATR